MTIHPYLQFKGNCQEAFDLYKSVFGKDFQSINLYSEAPAGSCPFPAGWESKIMFISLPINDQCTLMGCDYQDAQATNTFSLSIDAESRAHADQLFAALSKDGKVVMPMADTFWKAYFGMLEDKFGVSWIVNFSQCCS